MLGLVGEFRPEKMDWVSFKSHIVGSVKCVCVAWVTIGEWDDMILPPIISSAVDKLQALLIAKAKELNTDGSGQPLIMGNIPELEANGPPVFGFLPAERSRNDVEKVILENGGQLADFPPIAIAVLQLVPQIGELITAIKAWIAAHAKK